MKITVITVCFNAMATIRNTIESVLNQDYLDIEYVVQDGNSTDGTIEVIKEYEKKFADKGMEYKYYSESDSGIYDAMNRALEKVSGDWVIFMNADDSFCSNNTIKSIFTKKNISEYDIVYGGCYRNDGISLYETPANDIITLPKKMPFMHQSVFVKSTLYQKNRYDVRYHLCADYELFFRFFVKKYKFLKCTEYISNYSIEGISAQNDILAIKEVIDIKKKYQSYYKISLKDRVNWLFQFFVMKVKHILPKQLISNLRFFRAQRQGYIIK